MPFILLLSLFLAGFGGVGWGIQELLAHGPEGYPAASYAIIGGIAGGILLIKVLGEAISTLFRDEPEAVFRSSLPGHTAVATTGVAKKAYPALAKNALLCVRAWAGKKS